MYLSTTHFYFYFGNSHSLSQRNWSLLQQWQLRSSGCFLSHIKTWPGWSEFFPSSWLGWSHLFSRSREYISHQNVIQMKSFFLRSGVFLTPKHDSNEDISFLDLKYFSLQNVTWMKSFLSEIWSNSHIKLWLGLSHFFSWSGGFLTSKYDLDEVP